MPLLQIFSVPCFHVQIHLISNLTAEISGYILPSHLGVAE